MRNVFIIIFLLSLIGCNSSTFKLGISLIKVQYKCDVSYSKTVSASFNGEKNNVIELKLAGGSLLDSFPYELICSHAALILFKNLSIRDQHKYATISCSVEQKGDNSVVGHKVDFNMNDLRLMKNKDELYEKYCYFVLLEIYDSFYNYFAPELESMAEKDKLLHELDSLAVTLGQPVQLFIYGFEKYDTEHEGKDYKMIRVYGGFEREKIDYQSSFFLDFSRDLKDNQIYGYSY